MVGCSFESTASGGRTSPVVFQTYVTSDTTSSTLTITVYQSAEYVAVLSNEPWAPAEVTFTEFSKSLSQRDGFRAFLGFPKRRTPNLRTDVISRSKWDTWRTRALGRRLLD